jgi:endo-1,3-1,4-beta-glycanase ExoK
MNSRPALLVLVVAAALVPTSAMGMASAELYSTKPSFYGRFDARIQFAPGDGVVSSFFLWKEGSEVSGAYWAELDYEKLGADCHMQLNNIYGNPATQHQQNPTLGFNLCGGYHDYRIEWTPTYIAWIVDGKEIRRDTGADATGYAQNATAGMTVHFNIWPGNSSFGGNINNTTLPVRQYISWVQYSSYDNGNFNVQWREEFQSSGVPSGWAVGNWTSPYNLSTHNTQNVAFVNGIAVLSLTADNATGTPGTPPVDDAAGGTGSGGSTGSGGVTATGGTGSGGMTASGGAIGSGGAISKGGNSAGSTTAAGGTTSSGGMTEPGSSATSGGATGSGGRTLAGGSGGSSISSDVTASGGSPHSSATSSTGGDAGGAVPGHRAGCSCSAANPTSPLGPALLVSLIVISFSYLRRKEF